MIAFVFICVNINILKWPVVDVFFFGVPRILIDIQGQNSARPNNNEHIANEEMDLIHDWIAVISSHYTRSIYNARDHYIRMRWTNMD